MTNTQTISSTYGGLEVKRKFTPGDLTSMVWLVSAPPKKGKSHLGANIPGAVGADFEDKWRHIPDVYRKAEWVVPKTLKEFDAWHKQMVVDGLAGKCPFNMVVLDTANEFVYNILSRGMTDELKATGQSFGPGEDIWDYKASPKGSKGAGMVSLRMSRYVRDLKAAGLGVMILTHDKEVKLSVGGQETTVYRAALSDGVVGRLYQAAEFLAKVSLRTVVEMGDAPVLNPDGTPKLSASGTPLITKQRIERTAQFIRFMELPSQPDRELGTNVPMPPEIELPLGKAWETIVAAHKATLAARAE